MRKAEAVRAGRVLIRDILVAECWFERMRGLLGMASLPEGSAIYLPRSKAIHTFFMRFALDVLFVERFGVVLRFERNVMPWRMLWCAEAYGVIETQTGWLARSGIAVGDAIEIIYRD